MSVEIAPRDVIALRATVEPMLMSDRRALMTSVTPTAGRGMFQPGET